jgi:branched-chain amino acid transport system ATP-binding protein/branched-chain amino acid transport system permease protein
VTRAERAIALVLGGLVVAAVGLVPVTMRLVLADDNYWLQVAIWVLFFAYLSAAWNLIGGFAGQYSIGHSGLLGIGAYTSSLLYIHGGLSPWLGMLVGGVAAAVVGGVIGYPCFRLRGAFFSLVTIAFAEMLRVGTELTDTLFGLEVNGVRGLLLPVRGHDPAAFQFVDKRFYYYAMLALLLAVLAVGWTVKRSRLGFYLAAIGDDEDAVASLGINPARAKLAAMGLSAFFTALAGTFYAQFILFITPTRTMGLDFSVQMVIMAVLGGMGTVLGPVYGALILVPIAELTRATWGGGIQGAHLIVYGALLMGVILYAPQGVEGWVRRHAAGLVRWLAARLAAPAPSAVPEVANRPEIVLPEGALLGDRPSAAGTGAPLLVLRGVGRRFGGAVALRDFTLQIEPGEAVGLIGPNGAGKTTIFNLVTGFLRPSAGAIAYGSIDLTRLRPDAINRLGIARTFQIVRPFTRLTTRDNVVVAALGGGRGGAQARGEDERPPPFVGLRHRAEVLADGLSTGERKRLELARALATRPRLLLLDEVLGGVDQASLPGLVALIQKIKREGLTLLIIEHNLRAVTAVADRLVMLHLGEKVCEGDPGAVVRDPQVVEIYVGGAPALR